MEMHELKTYERLLQTDPISKSRSARWFSTNALGTLAMAPAGLMMLGLIFIPFALVIALSFTNWTGLGPVPLPETVRNYTGIFASDSFVRALKVTVVYAIGSGVLTITIGFVLAALIRARLTGWRLYKVVWFIPVLLPGAVIAVLWSSAIFEPGFGALDQLLELVHLPTPTQGWLGDPNLAVGAIIVTAIWAYTGWPMLILLAAMERIPQDFFDAANVDGASAAATTWYVTMPMVRPVLAGVATLQLIFGLKAFDIVFVLTNGGPASATRVLSLLMFTDAFTAGRFGLGSAIAVLMVAIIVPAALLQQRLLSGSGK
jgi:raffinose/stachyose/melibiose transport system permease protein